MGKGATAGINPEATPAAHTNYEFFAEEVVTTDEIPERLKLPRLVRPEALLTSWQPADLEA